MTDPLPICRFREPLTEDRARCLSGWVKAPAQGVPLDFCQTCPYADRPGDPRQPLTTVCGHRGALIEVVKTPGCSNCQGVTEVVQCRRHDAPVTLHRVRDTRGRTWRSCLACMLAVEHLPQPEEVEGSG